METQVKLLHICLYTLNITTVVNRSIANICKRKSHNTHEAHIS